MAKAASADAGNKADKAAKEAPKAAKEAAKPKPGSEQKDAEAKPSERLAALRFRNKCGFLFFFGFLGFCAWLVLIADTCRVNKKFKRKDCGYSGISKTECRTVASFLWEDTSTPRTVKVSRTEGAKLGIKMKQGKFKEPWSMINEISDAGAVKAHNDNLPADSDQRLQVGDRVLKVDGATGAKLTKALANTKSTSITFELVQPSEGTVASYLPPAWLGPTSLGRFLRSKGVDRMWKMFLRIGGVGSLCWFLSGYGIASVPLYYFGSSAGVAWWLTRCCYDDSNVKGSEPHCYCGTDEGFDEVLAQAWKKTSLQQLRTDMMKLVTRSKR